MEASPLCLSQNKLHFFRLFQTFSNYQLNAQFLYSAVRSQPAYCTAVYRG